MAELKDYERNLVDKIAKHGFFTTGVFDPEGNDPHFRYSIGFLPDLGQPECIILGLDLKLMHSMIGALYDQLKEGVTLGEHTEISGLLGGDFTCIARPVATQYLLPHYFNSALWYNRYRGGSDETFKAVQIIWPGAQNGLYPWQDEDVASFQPLLCEPP